MNCPHCNAHIDEHPASRCLDAWVAQVIEGWTLAEAQFALALERNGINEYVSGPNYKALMHYSTSIAAAWQVVEKLIALDPLGDFHLEHLADEWRVGFCVHDEWFPFASTAPLAICRAAIKASNATQ